MKTEEKVTIAAGCGAYLLATLFWLTIWGTIAYVAYHFISKWW